MLQNLKEPSVIVMGHASYHSVCVHNHPKSNEKKINVQKWLQKKGVEFSLCETLAELQERMKLSIPQEKKIRAR